MNTFDLILDLDKRYENAPVRIRQGDKSGTTIRASIYDHGTPLAGTYTSRVVIALPDREHYYRKSATYSGGVATVTIDETTAAAVAGSGEGYFQILSGSTVIASTQTFPVLVLPDATANATVPESYDTAIQEAIDGLNEAVADLPDTVEDVLAAHPEWTTTVQDNSLPDSKLVQSGGILSRNQRLMYRLANLLTHRTDEGTLVAISDAAKTPMAGLSVYGQSTQDGTPTPEAPVPIVSVQPDSEGNISLRAQGLNVAHPMPGTRENKGITATVAEDGWITISGTSTATGSALVGIGIGSTDNSARTIEGAPTFALYIENEGALVSGEVELQVYGSDGEATNVGGYAAASRTFDMLTDYISRIYVFLRAASNGKTYDGRFRFSLVRSEQMPTAYIPYVETVTPIPLDGHELRSLPDGTRDELTVDAEGHATLVQRVGVATFDGTENWMAASASGVFNLVLWTQSAGTLIPASQQSGLCDRLTWDSAGVASMADGTFKVGSSGTSEYAFIVNKSYTTATEIKAWLAENPKTITYKLPPEGYVTHDLGTVDPVPLVGPDLTAQMVPSAPFVLDAERDLNVTLARLESAIAALA